MVNYGTKWLWYEMTIASEKTIDLPQVTDKLYVVSSTPLLSEIRTDNFSGDRH